MFVCSCIHVSDRAVRAAIDQGARTIEEIGERCGAGSACGGCWPELQRLLDRRDTVEVPRWAAWRPPRRRAS